MCRLNSDAVVQKAFVYRREGVSFDYKTFSGNRYAYATFGAACSEVEIDCLTGDHTVGSAYLDILGGYTQHIFVLYVFLCMYYIFFI